MNGEFFRNLLDNELLRAESLTSSSFAGIPLHDHGGFVPVHEWGITDFQAEIR